MRICPRDFLSIGQGFRGLVTGSEHQRRLAKRQGREKEKSTRLVWQCTRVQRRSSLGKYVLSELRVYIPEIQKGLEQ